MSKSQYPFSKNNIPPLLLKVSADIEAEKGHCYIVGGWVRDSLLGIPCHDFDVEVYGLELKTLQSILSRYGAPNFVGKAFGVVTMTRKGITYDFAFPRRESKVGVGHRGFAVQTDPFLSFKEASSRRDFTLNAMGIKLPELILEDPHGGQSDLNKKLLKHVSPAFNEDPLRALRAVQFAARFNFDIHPDTQEICSQQPLEELPPERIFEEFKKLLLQASKPSIGLEWLRKMNLLRYFPELEALIGVQQDPEWHPEGDVWIHNNMVVDQAAILRDQISKDGKEAEFDKLALMLGTLCHDFGKPITTIYKDERWRSPAHDVMGEKPTRNFLNRMTRDRKLIEEVVVLVREHLKPALLYNARHEVKPGAIRRLALKVNIEKLVRAAKADHFGRTTPDAIEKRFEAGDWLLEQSRQLNVLEQKPKPLLTGKHLIALGMTPGKAMGDFIQKSFELQLEGQFQTVEDVLEWARVEIKTRA